MNEFFDRRVYFQFDDRQMVYVAVPKVASTSILYAIGREYGLSNHQRIGARQHLAKYRYRGSLKRVPKGYFKFGFVRNPFERLVSCYHSKVVLVREDSTKRYLYANPPFNIPITVTFAQFVEQIAQIPDKKSDRHFKSQTSILYKKQLCLVDFIGRFERLGQDWVKVARRCGLSPNLPHIGNSQRLLNIPSDFRSYYTPALIERVYRRYRADFRRFGYENTYSDLLAFANKSINI